MQDLIAKRYVTFWRKTGEQCLDWDYHVSFNLEDAKKVVANIKARGVHQYSTQALGDPMTELSSDY